MAVLFVLLAILTPFSLASPTSNGFMTSFHKEKLDIASLTKRLVLPRIDTFPITTETERDINPRSNDFKTSIRPLSDLEEILDLDSAVKTFDVPSLDTTSAITNTPFTNSKKLISRTFNPFDRRCLHPAHQPIPADCEALCENLNHIQGPVLIEPLHIWHFEQGHCLFGVANLDACERLDIDPINILQPYCISMYHQCIRDGYDGFIEGSNPKMGMALTGTAAAPPYSNEGC